MKNDKNVKGINNRKLIRTIIGIFNWKNDRNIIKLLGNIKEQLLGNIRKY